jgi:hypothetical protein
MKILLQHTGSRLFHKTIGVWVQEESEARAFDSALEAIEYCERQGLAGVEIVLRPAPFGATGPVPLSSEPRRSPPTG